MIKKSSFNAEKHCPQFGQGFELQHETCILCASNIRCAQNINVSNIIDKFTAAISVERDIKTTNISK